MEHPGIESLFPLLVLDSGFRDLSSWLHVPHVRGMLPDLFHHHRLSCRIYESNSRDFWPNDFFPFFIFHYLVRVYFLSIASRELIYHLAMAFYSRSINLAGGNGCTIFLHILT